MKDTDKKVPTIAEIEARQKERNAVRYGKQFIVPVVDADSGNVHLPPELIDQVLMTEDESNRAYGTHLHSLKLMEALLLTGNLNKQEVLQTVKTLAEYQFVKASSTRKPAEKEKTIEDYLQELEDEQAS